MTDVQTTRNESEQRYEARVGDELAGFAAYQSGEDGVVVFTHTEVDDSYEGQGVGSSLVRDALDDVRSKGGKVVAQCEFVKEWIERHPDQQDLLA
jgi:uncharacterized protein